RHHAVGRTAGGAGGLHRGVYGAAAADPGPVGWGAGGAAFPGGPPPGPRGHPPPFFPGFPPRHPAPLAPPPPFRAPPRPPPGPPPLSAALTNAPPARTVAPPARQQEPARADKPEQSETIICSGRVLSPDGKPVPGAKLLLRLREGPDKDLSVRGTTDKEGKFHFTIKRSELEADGYVRPWFALIATAEGHAPDWNYVYNPAGKGEGTLRLPHD